VNNINNKAKFTDRTRELPACSNYTGNIITDRTDNNERSQYSIYSVVTKRRTFQLSGKFNS